MKNYQYEFINKSCPNCNGTAVKDFWTTNGVLVAHNDPYCPKCKIKIFDENRETWVITKDPTWESIVRSGALHILASRETWFVRTVQDHELIKKHGVEAHWFTVGRKVYIEPFDSVDSELASFIALQPVGMTLVFLPNSHLQRLYFFVPNNAIHH